MASKNQLATKRSKGGEIVIKEQRSPNAISVPGEVVCHVILALFALACIIPFIFVIIISFTDKSSILTKGYSFIPNALSLDAYKYVGKLGKSVFMAYGNSILITVVGTLCTMIVTCLYSYALSRRDYRLRGFFTFWCFFTVLFGGGLAPTYVVCKQMLGLSNSYAAIIVPLLLNAFNIIIMRTFYQSTVPVELIEAASIDGCGEYRTLWSIVLPISKPGIATVSLLSAIAYWNEWFVPMLYVKDAGHKVLQQVLMDIQRTMDMLVKNAGLMGPDAVAVRKNMPQNSLKFALVVMLVLPIACAYPFFQRYIVAGLTVGSVKG